MITLNAAISRKGSPESTALYKNHAGCRLRRGGSALRKCGRVDPLECPKCHAEMKIISFISKSQPEVIRKILLHLGLWEEKTRPPPSSDISPDKVSTYEPFDDGRPGYEEPCITVD